MEAGMRRKCVLKNEEYKILLHFGVDEAYVTLGCTEIKVIHINIVTLENMLGYFQGLCCCFRAQNRHAWEVMLI